MSFWDSFTSLKFDQYGPVLLLFGIMLTFLGACMFHSMVLKKSEDEAFTNSTLSQSHDQKVVLTDGDTGVERQADVSALSV